MPDDSFLVDLHPMHQQVDAHLKLLLAGMPADEKTRRAIEALKQCQKALSEITCSGMGVDVTYA